jgi:hypothetical protein
MRAWHPSVTLFKYTSGVWPINSVTSFAIFTQRSYIDETMYRVASPDAQTEALGAKSELPGLRRQ